jgi:hypothetical protein
VIDWLSYPILDITEAPEAVDIVLINRPNCRVRRRRELDPPGRRGYRQCRLRRHRCAPAPRSPDTGAAETVIGLELACLLF